MGRSSEIAARKLLEELNQAVKRLPQLAPERQEEVVVQICEVTRDVRLLSGPPHRASDELISEIGDCFASAVDAIKKLEKLSATAEDYLENIENRADMFRELKEARCTEHKS
jgi:hypothetical protein